MSGKPYIKINDGDITLHNSSGDIVAEWGHTEAKEDYLNLIEVARSLHFGDKYMRSLFENLYGYEWDE